MEAYRGGTLLLALWGCMTIYRQSQDYGSIRITEDQLFPNLSFAKPGDLYES